MHLRCDACGSPLRSRPEGALASEACCAEHPLRSGALTSLRGGSGTTILRLFRAPYRVPESTLTPQIRAAVGICGGMAGERLHRRGKHPGL